jgi:hypothetical protein
VTQIWQKIEGRRHSCHWWQEHDWRMITAMTDILITSLVVLGLLIALAGLVLFARGDGFAGPGIGHRAADELGPLGFRRRPA